MEEQVPKKPRAVIIIGNVTMIVAVLMIVGALFISIVADAVGGGYPGVEK